MKKLLHLNYVRNILKHSKVWCDKLVKYFCSKMHYISFSLDINILQFPWSAQWSGFILIISAIREIKYLQNYAKSFVCSLCWVLIGQLQDFISAILKEERTRLVWSNNCDSIPSHWNKNCINYWPILRYLIFFAKQWYNCS